MAMRLLGGFWLLVAAFAGCDREPPVVPAPPAKTTAAVDIESITPLPPGRRTHLAPNWTGQIFWVQESEGAGGEIVFAMPEGGLPQATGFGSSSITRAMGQEGAGGNIQSLAFGRGGQLFFFFTGGKKRQSVTALGYFVPGSGQVRMLSDTTQLARDSGLGASLSLARGTLVRSGESMWLWLRHSDGFALLALDLSRAGALPRRMFDRVRAPLGDLRLTSPTEDLSGLGDGSLLYLDRATGKIWRITASGQAAELALISDLPKTITTPVIDDRGRMVLWAPPGPAFNESGRIDIAPSTAPAISFPAVVLIDPRERKVLGAQAISAPSRLNLQELAPATVSADRSSLILYDGPTGELLRVRVADAPQP